MHTCIRIIQLIVPVFAVLLQEIHASSFNAFIENVDFLHSPSLYVFLELSMFYINLMVLIKQNGVKRKFIKLIMPPDPFSYRGRNTTWNYNLYSPPHMWSRSQRTWSWVKKQWDESHVTECWRYAQCSRRVLTRCLNIVTIMAQDAEEYVMEKPFCICTYKKNRQTDYKNVSSVNGLPWGAFPVQQRKSLL